MLLATNVAAFARRACLGAESLGTDYTFVPSPASCSEYVLCQDGEQHIDSCPVGFQFDAPTQSCPETSGWTPSSCIGCAQIGIVNLPHHTDCQRFHECNFGKRTERTCREGFAFDRTVGECNLASLVDCSDREVVPEEPEFPIDPELPVDPEQPIEPEQPQGPNEPDHPQGPGWPGVDPDHPQGPGPAQPGQPIGPFRPLVARRNI